MIKKHTFHELREIFDEVIKIPERLDEMTIVQLRELYYHLEERKERLMKTVVHRLCVEVQHPSFGTEHHEYLCKRNCYEYSMCVADLEYWMEVLVKKVNKESKKTNQISLKHPFNVKVFKDVKSQCLFELIVEKWLSAAETQKNALHYVYHRMSINSVPDADEENGKLDSFTILATQKEFAKYWDNVYSPLHPNKLRFTYKSNGNPNFSSFDGMGTNAIKRYKTRLNGIIGQM